MKIYGTPSSRTRRCLWTLEEVGADYTLEPVDFGKGEHLTEEFRRLNPNGRVPVLVDGDLVLFESAAICTYVAQRYPEAGLIPPVGTSENALYLQWMFWIVTELEQPLWSMGKHRFALPEEHRLPAMLEVATFEWKRAVVVLAAAMEGREFLVGDRFTLADVMAGHTLLWGRGFKASFNSQVLEDYLDRMIDRPAFKRTLKA